MQPANQGEVAEDGDSPVDGPSPSVEIALGAVPLSISSTRTFQRARSFPSLDHKVVLYWVRRERNRVRGEDVGARDGKALSKGPNRDVDARKAVEYSRLPSSAAISWLIYLSPFDIRLGQMNPR